jgi:hypothetical protein
VPNRGPQGVFAQAVQEGSRLVELRSTTAAGGDVGLYPRPLGAGEGIGGQQRNEPSNRT